jgi:hypothetical protein
MGIIEKLGEIKVAKILDSKSLKGIKKVSGVYVMIYMKNGKPENFSRLNGIDPEGILCIGKAANLNRRIREFQRDVLVKGLGKHYHSEGWNFRKYFRDNPNPNALKLKIENIKVVWKELSNKNEAEANALETKLLQEYVMRYQDKPPLNISIKRKRS